MSVKDLPSWKKLEHHYAETKLLHMRDLFERAPDRFDRFSLELEDILFDYSKNLITEKTVSLLFDLASECRLSDSIEAMFSGKKINVTEDRHVLHIALRNRSGRAILAGGRDVMPGIHAVLNKMENFSNEVRSGSWKGFDGDPITDVVNIGIGGSDLGPRMVCEALDYYAASEPRIHFVSNVDGTDLAMTLKYLNPRTTLFIVSSKSFTTQETMLNAGSAKKWFLDGGGREISRHFVAVSTNEKEVVEFGVDPSNMFEFWDWVGGRYSVWSAIGLSVAVAIGMDRFYEFLEGAHIVDEHFRSAPFETNIPVIMGLLGIWYNNFFDARTCAVLPYDRYLSRFPAYLQQLDMESNGKRTTKEGEGVDYQTGPVIWGEPGTNGQHAFFQLLHQGTKLVPCDFLAAAESLHPEGDHHRVLTANFIAQTEALMRGRTVAEAEEELKRKGPPGEKLNLLANSMVCPGNKPTNSIVYSKLTPKTLGMLIALYEHKIFTQGIIWNINSFDQMGVELGKELARNILPELEKGSTLSGHDSSTTALIRYIKKH
ncbi:MAG: glucose-6-phosphate isomerase [Syntrophales bacterium]|jgi:glucose-6-phosphate isomerase|nr:glucose-6-phosphate isomerase [Syntrophales bacterium]MDY0043734.1 glucose-6-phosphate isomerase [Syntrophales bacterium]